MVRFDPEADTDEVVLEDIYSPVDVATIVFTVLNLNDFPHPYIARGDIVKLAMEFAEDEELTESQLRLFILAIAGKIYHYLVQPKFRKEDLVVYFLQQFNLPFLQ